MGFDNTAAWVPFHKAHPFQIAPASISSPGENQVLVRNHAIGINPIEFKVQYTDLHKDDFTYPAIFGEDVAGEVVAIGPGVTKFKVGDRIAGIPRGFITGRNEEKAFQAYTLLQTSLSAGVPQKYSFEQAVVFPLGVSTAAAGLFNPDALNLHTPTYPPRKPNGKVLLVWGGASCVGGNAIQLAVAAGYEVLSTASPKNFEAVKKLGASHVFDYQSASVVADLIKVLDGRESVGVLDAIGPNAAEQIHDYVNQAGGRKFIATTVPGSAPEGVTNSFINVPAITFNHVGSAVWDGYLPEALEAGDFVPFPRPLVKGQGLESLQGAVDYLRSNGASAEKVVVSL